MRINIILLAAVLTAAVLTAGCASVGEPSETAYRQVNAEEARNLMDTEKDYVILDVRTQSEFDEGHIPGAVLLPHDTVRERAEEVVPDKDQLLLVYCRSGNRSKQASQALTELGYTDVVEFGGINDWPYEIEK